MIRLILDNHQYKVTTGIASPYKEYGRQEGGILLRQWTLDEIQARVESRRKKTEEALYRMRQLWEAEEGKRPRRRNRPRNPNESRVLTLMAKKNWERAVQSGQVHYDPERRVLRIERLVRLTERTANISDTPSVRSDDGNSRHVD